MKRTFKAAALGLSFLVASGGIGVTEDYYKDSRRLAEKGDAFHQRWLGTRYYYGSGVKKDYKAALKWFLLSSEQGDADAQLYLGYMYGSGRGVIQDKVYAHMWFNIAASNGDDGVARDWSAKTMTATEISQALSLARACVAKKYKGC